LNLKLSSQDQYSAADRVRKNLARFGEIKRSVANFLKPKNKNVKNNTNFEGNLIIVSCKVRLINKCSLTKKHNYFVFAIVSLKKV